MKKNVLNTHVFELLDSLERNLSAYTKDLKPEYLHQLRLDIKQIRAIFSFATKVYKEKIDAAILRPLFQKAGSIREIHINIDLLLADPDSPEDLVPLLKEKENILVKEFLQDVTNYHKVINDFREQVSLPEELPRKKKIIKFFKNEKRKASNIFVNIDSEGLHDYRILIKKILYAFKALPKKLRIKIELNTAKISEQQKKLGQWHDTYAAVEFYTQEDFSTLTPEYILKLKEIEKKEFEKILENLSVKRVR